MCWWQRYVTVFCTLWVMGASSQPSSAARHSPSSPVTGTLTVFAAASLTESFTAIGKHLGSRHPGLRMLFNFAGSQALRTQIEQGALADVFASADVLQMQLAQKNGAVQDEAPIFIKNRLTIIVPRKPEGQVTTLRELATPGLKLVLAGQHVPVGRYSRQVLHQAAADYGDDFEARVLQNLVSEEHNVKQVVTKIQLGEADVGMVYVSDITQQIQHAVQTIPIPDAYNQIASYPIAIVKGTRQRAAAEAFIGFVLSAQGQAIMKSYNFVPVVE